MRIEKKAQILIRALAPVLFSIILFSTSCINEKTDPCPSYLKIVYDYNMAFVDQFHVQVNFLSIFMFDAETGLFIREAKVTQSPFPEGYRVEIPTEWYGPRYDIVVWAGLDPDSYEYPTLTPGTSTITDFQLKVKGYENYMIEREGALEPLWHGKLLGVTFETEKEYRLSLMKDTKKFRLVIQTLDEFDSLTKEDLDIILMSSGGWYDNDNNVLDPKGRGLIYFPYYMIDDPDTGVAIEINSMRLMNEDDRIHRLIINDAKEGYQILNIPLMKYLNALRLLEFSHIPFQEYLDREDTYNILIFLRKEDDGGEKPQPPRGNWVSVKIMINDWVIRFQDIN